MSDIEINALPIRFDTVNELLLKRLLLIFDKVCLLEPSEHKFLLSPYSMVHNGTKLSYPNPSDPLYNGEKYEKIETDILNKFEYARKHNFITCKSLKHSGFYDKYAIPLKFTRHKDFNNPKILKFLSPFCEKAQAPNKVGAPIADFIAIPDKNRRVDFRDLSSIIPDTDCNIDHYISNIGRINRLLIASEHFNLIPVFTQNSAFDFFKLKIDLARANNEPDVNSIYERCCKSKLSAIQYLLFKISQSIIPDDVLENMPVRELLIARNNTFHELYKVRQKMLKLFNQITELQYTDTFNKEVENFVNKEVIPHVNEYNQKFLENFVKVAKNISQFAGAALSVYIGTVQSLRPIDIALLSGSTAVLGDYIYKLVDHLAFNKRDKFKNTFSYFINIRETFES